jgi:hypothetical protein
MYNQEGDGSCRFNPYDDSFYTAGFSSMRAVVSDMEPDSLRSGWQDWVVSNSSMYQNPYVNYLSALENEAFVFRYDIGDDTDLPRCRRGIPRLSDGNEAKTPRWGYDGVTELDERAPSNFICDNHTNMDLPQSCWHIKLHAAYCVCNGEYGDGMCSTNIEETSQETLVWVSPAASLRSGLQWQISAMMALPTLVAWMMR